MKQSGFETSSYSCVYNFFKYNVFNILTIFKIFNIH